MNDKDRQAAEAIAERAFVSGNNDCEMCGGYGHVEEGGEMVACDTCQESTVSFAIIDTQHQQEWVDELAAAITALVDERVRSQTETIRLMRNGINSALACQSPDTLCGGCRRNLTRLAAIGKE